MAATSPELAGVAAVVAHLVAFIAGVRATEPEIIATRLQLDAEREIEKRFPAGADRDAALAAVDATLGPLLGSKT